jgi:rhodanese-related sulfurtransferase
VNDAIPLCYGFEAVRRGGQVKSETRRKSPDGSVEISISAPGSESRPRDNLVVVGCVFGLTSASARVLGIVFRGYWRLGRVERTIRARGGEEMTVTRRPAINDLLDAARTDLDRVEPAALAAEVAAGAVVIDIRPVEQRHRDGALPGAVVVDRNVLEWRLDPTSPHRLPFATSADIRYVVVCNEGYSSSLAAATLRQLGMHRATDLVGGYRAWTALSASDRGNSSRLQAP